MSEIARDIRYAMRQARRSPGFTAVAVLTLGLGIGMNTALFSLIDAALFKPLPVFHPEQLVSVIVTTRSGWMSNVPASLFSQLQAGSQSFSGAFAYWQDDALVMRDGDVERTPIQQVSGDYYSVLGVRPVAGRLLQPSDDATFSDPVAVISYQYWIRRFSGDRTVVGRQLHVDGTPYTIVGVTPAVFFGTDRSFGPDVTVAFGPLPRRHARLWIVARKRPAVPLANAGAEVELAWQRALAADQPTLTTMNKSARDEILGYRAGLVSAENGAGAVGLREELPRLRVLGALSLLVLLIACANVANLLIARAMGRAPEIGTRLAIGATAGRLVRQSLIESLVLSAMGTVVGVVVGAWAHRVLLAFFMGDSMPAGAQFALDGRLLVFAAVATLLTTMLFGLVPAMRAARVDVLQNLKGSAGITKSARHARLTKAVVIAQVAACVVLSFAAALLGRTLVNLRTTERGFRSDLLLVNVEPADARKPGQDAARLYETILRRVREVPGVASVSLAARAAFAGSRWQKSIWIDGPSGAQEGMTAFNVVAPGFFDTAGIALRSGRDFSSRDRAGSHPVVIVNEAFVRRFGPARGVSVRFGDGRAIHYEVIGLVANAKTTSLREHPPPIVYEPLLQESRPGAVVLHVRTTTNTAAAAAAIRNRLRGVDPALTVWGERTLDADIDASLRRDRLMALLSMFSAGLAVLLTCVGVFGVVANTVATRTREIGLRVALGANRRDVLTVVLGGSLKLTAVGTAIGVGLALASGRLLASLLFGLSPSDPAALIGAAIMLVAVGCTAAYLPARRAVKLDPIAALRSEP